MANTYHVATDGSGDFTTIAQVQTAHATFVVGDSILFRKGDTWNEDWDISGISGVTIGSYGTGDLPKLQYLHQWGSGEDYLTIENLHFRSSTGNVVEIYGGHDITIQNCTFSNDGNVTGALINIASLTSGRAVYNINVLNCVGDGAGLAAGFNVQGDNSGGHDILFEGNTLTNCAEIGLQAYAVTADIYNITFRGNTISGTVISGGAGHGINVGCRLYNSTIEKNYCYNNENFGIVMDAGVHDVVVKNNLCINNGNNIGGQGNTYGAIYNIKFYNNTLIYGVGTTYSGLFLNIAQGGHDITFKNNIVVSNDYRQEIMDNNDNFTNIVSDYNCFQEKLDPSGPRFRYNGTNVYLTAWQAIGQDSHSIALDPLLTSDYKLQFNSPCKDNGITLTEVTDDYQGTPRPLGASNDIGANEWFKSRVKTATLKNVSI